MMWTYVPAIIVALPLFDGLTGCLELVVSAEVEHYLREWWPLIGALSLYILMWSVTRHWVPEAAGEEEEEENIQFAECTKSKSTTQTAATDSEPDSQYPDGYVFTSNYVRSQEELEKLRRETTQKALRELFRSQEWRAHLRERGREESAYNWQRRQSLSSSDSKPGH